MICLENVSCGYGRGDVLRGVDLTIARGEMAAVLGPNGSGKTTLLKAISGVLPLSGGKISINGIFLEDLSIKARARAMASVPQQADSAFDLKVRSLVLMGRYPYLSLLGGYSEEDRETAMQAMQETGVDGFAERKAGELSGGEFRRVLVARALTQNADILLMDEAASNLDIARKVEVTDLLLSRNRQGATVVSAIHDLNLAALYCPRLIFLKQGRVVLDGATDVVFTEENISRIYETEVKIGTHPVTGSPQVHLVPGGAYADPGPGRV